MTPAEKKVLLAAAASPLRRLLLVWHRADGPAIQRLTDNEHLALRRLLELDYVGGGTSELTLTDAGIVQAKAIRHVLGRRRREILAAIGAAGELVRRERETTDAEYCEILASGAAPTETVTEWVEPHRTAPALGYPREICSSSELQDLVDRGLVVLLNGGTRAVLSGAGRWCATGTRDRQ